MTTRARQVISSTHKQAFFAELHMMRLYKDTHHEIRRAIHYAYWYGIHEGFRAYNGELIKESGGEVTF